MTPVLYNWKHSICCYYLLITLKCTFNKVGINLTECMRCKILLIFVYVKNI